MDTKQIEQRNEISGFHRLELRIRWNLLIGWADERSGLLTSCVIDRPHQLDFPERLFTKIRWRRPIWLIRELS